MTTVSLLLDAQNSRETFCQKFPVIILKVIQAFSTAAMRAKVRSLMLATETEDMQLCTYALKRNGHDVHSALQWMARLGLSKAGADRGSDSDDGERKLDDLIEALVDELSVSTHDESDDAYGTPEKSEVPSSCDVSPDVVDAALSPPRGLQLPENRELAGIVADEVARLAISAYLTDGLMDPISPARAERSVVTDGTDVHEGDDGDDDDAGDDQLEGELRELHWRLEQAEEDDAAFVARAFIASPVGAEVSLLPILPRDASSATKAALPPSPPPSPRAHLVTFPSPPPIVVRRRQDGLHRVELAGQLGDGCCSSGPGCALM